jgi:hypothetical protein
VVGQLAVLGDALILGFARAQLECSRRTLVSADADRVLDNDTVRSAAIERKLARTRALAPRSTVGARIVPIGKSLANDKSGTAMVYQRVTIRREPDASSAPIVDSSSCSSGAIAPLPGVREQIVH